MTPQPEKVKPIDLDKKSHERKKQQFLQFITISSANKSQLHQLTFIAIFILRTNLT